MTERQMTNRIKNIQALERMRDDLDKQIEKLKDEIKAEMNDTETMTAGEFVVHWSHVVSSRLDTKAIKIDLPDIYNKYIKETCSRRFSITTA